MKKKYKNSLPLHLNNLALHWIFVVEQPWAYNLMIVMLRSYVYAIWL
jgi:hypothetical protein